MLADVTHEFASSLNVEETLQNAIDQIIVYLNAEAASIFLLEENGQSIICRKCAGPVDITGLKLGVDQGIVGKAIAENAELYEWVEERVRTPVVMLSVGAVSVQNIPRSGMPLVASAQP